MNIRLTIFVLLSLLYSASQAAIWRWTDPDSGEAVYGAYPPANLSAEAVRLDKAPARSDDIGEEAPSSADRIKSRLDELRSQREGREQQTQQAQAEKLATNQRSEACKSANTNLETLNSPGPMAIVEDGERRALTNAERQGYVVSTQKFIGEHCSGQ